MSELPPSGMTLEAKVIYLIRRRRLLLARLLLARLIEEDE